MKFIASKAVGKSNFVAPPAQSSMSKAAFAERFSAEPVHELGDDTNPFSTMQLASELQTRLTRLARRGIAKS